MASTNKDGWFLLGYENLQLGAHILTLISGFHRALLESITFIIRLMHSIIQNLEFKIYVV